MAAQKKLLSTLQEACPEVEVKAVLSTVKDGIEYFKTLPLVDIIFSDVQLPDGLSFEIFSETQIKIPVIFTTGYDKFMLSAFEFNGIDYLLKPIENEDLRKALLKYKMLEKHFDYQNNSLKNLLHFFGTKNKKRIIVKKGIENISILLENVVIFYSENKLVYIIDNNNKKFITDKTLIDLEAELDNSIFFRANRQYIINLNFVKSYKSYEKVKIQVDLSISESNHFIIVSQIAAPLFRKWISAT